MFKDPVMAISNWVSINKRMTPLNTRYAASFDLSFSRQDVFLHLMRRITARKTMKTKKLAAYSHRMALELATIS